MKTSEFKHRFEALDDNYKVSMTKNSVYLQYHGGVIGYIDREIRFGLGVNFSQSLPHLQELYMLATEFAGTLVEDRDPKLYRVHILRTTDGTYLNRNNKDKRYYTGGSDVFGSQTQFTMEEIGEMSRKKQLAIDWDKALEEVKDD
ncbi:hypothetical protein ACFP1L_12040 [Lactiplantibacillus nangangensis]|uniref:Uncharacterized protein n=1 Tax=Lactiplantibacillus nangangensis TaxID=2559917 RepID=A0ABW1SMT5_9LACO|nr:hypothetical protein [Lactiplantibacillus nangangensis]